jgi:hypothetical protein
MKPVLFFTLLFSCLTVFSQETGTETELDKRNGFKDIKLASPIDSVKGAKFKKDIKENSHPAKVYTIEDPEKLRSTPLKSGHTKGLSTRSLCLPTKTLA